MPELPSLLTQALGLEGWTALEPVLLAALASEDPLLLVGPHGSAKSFLLERLAKSLQLEYRFYNASLINYDDLVGIPMPDEDRKGLHYISTPSAIWDAEVVFFDEINRTRPELQNKLFPIVHERRVQGIPLERLRYRWSAMNPPPAPDSDDDLDVYLGAEPLDPALADRFSYVIEVPGWQQLQEDERRRVLRDQFRGAHEFKVPLNELIAATQRYLDAFTAEASSALEDYVLVLLDQLHANKLRLSARRATMLHRNILAVHAARTALAESAFPEFQSGLVDWKTSAILALRNSLPQVAQGVTPDPAVVLAAHRHAWDLALLDEENPWRTLLQIKDPMERCMSAIEMGPKVNDEYMSQLVVDALGAEENVALRRAAALPIYVATHRSRKLRATVFETLAQELRPALNPGSRAHDPDSYAGARYRQLREVCEEISETGADQTGLWERYALNLLLTLPPDSYRDVTPKRVLKTFRETWDQIVSGQAAEEEIR
jgi:MoxR-like ATPase